MSGHCKQSMNLHSTMKRFLLNERLIILNQRFGLKFIRQVIRNTIHYSSFIHPNQPIDIIYF